MSNSNQSGGVGAMGLLGVVFVTLKLTGIIDWSWWYVTMPFWGVIAIEVFLLIIYFVIAFAATATKSKKRKW